jgi:hypothetical protein
MKERDHWEDLGVDGRIILNISSRSGMGNMDWTLWLRIGTGGGTCECGNEPSGSI